MNTVNDIFAATRYGVLATVKPGNSPWSVPVGFVYEAGYVFFRSSFDAIHTKNIETNPNVAFTVLDTTQSTKGAIYIHSTAEILSGQAKENASSLLELHFNSPPPQWSTICYLRIGVGTMDRKKSTASMYYFGSIQNES